MFNKAGTNDWLTVAAIGLLAMCTVTFDHEAMGHGGACLAVHGHILMLSSSIFRCDRQQPLIDLAGPVTNIVCGLIALAVRSLLPPGRIKFRLFLLLVTGLSFFWEGGYLIHAMHHREGDMYFFLQRWLGNVDIWQRWMGTATGLAIYVMSAILTGRALLDLWPEAQRARWVARTVWISATTGAALGALAYRGNVNGDLRDAVLEIGAASVPLLFIPIRSRSASEGKSVSVIVRSNRVIAVAVAVYVAFVATLGRGLT